jgi:capsular exopolysaccharide synthesis family protein
LASLIDKYYELLINEKAGIPSAVVSGEPLAPPLPKYPIIPLNLGAGLLMAILVGFAMVLLVERFDSSLHDTTTAQSLSGLPIMAAIPEIQREKRKRGKKAKQELQQARESLIIGRMQPNPGFLESFRVLRGNLAFASPDRVVKILSITSPSKSEGKSTIAANTAISLAMDGKKVLLIDCDLRRPSVHTAFSVPKEHGLTSVVNGMMTLEEAIRPTEHENLSILTSGPLPPDPSEFLNSRAARAVIAEASKGYDITMLDSPPINGLSDGQVVSTLSDAMLLVASLDSTKKYELLASIRQLRQIHSPLLGLVLNRAKKQRGGYGYYSYYSYYPSYTDYEDDSKDDKKKKRGRKPQDDQATTVQ